MARAAVAAFFCLGAQALAAGDWPQFLGPSRNGEAAGEAIVSAFPGAGPRRLWIQEVGSGFSSPVVEGERVLLYHRRGGEEILECFDAATGASRWARPYPTAYHDDFGFDEGPRATPAIAEGRVFTLGAEGLLAATALADGGPIWRLDTRERFGTPKGFFGVACSPLVAGGRVIVNIGGRDGAGVIAADAKSGEIVWKSSAHEASYSSPLLAILGGRRQVVCFTRAGLLTLEPERGEVVHEFPWRPRINASVNAAAPVVLGDRIFLSTSYGRGAVLLDASASKLERVWDSDESLSSHYAPVLHRQGYLYGWHGRQEYGPELRCVEAASGAVKWSAKLAAGGAAILAGSRLILMHENGELALAEASPEGFRELARAEILPATVRALPALAAGRLYARNPRSLVCVDLRDDKK
jgi:outer membrane protein assembly factor BamB